MPNYEILCALGVAALAVDSVTVIAGLAGLVSAARRRWQKHKRE